MKLIIYQHSDGYYSIQSYGYFSRFNHDIVISALLDLKVNDYVELLIRQNGMLMSTHPNVVFKNREDTERAIEHLEPYIIMARLTE